MAVEPIDATAIANLLTPSLSKIIDDIKKKHNPASDKLAKAKKALSAIYSGDELIDAEAALEMSVGSEREEAKINKEILLALVHVAKELNIGRLALSDKGSRGAGVPAAGGKRPRASAADMEKATTAALSAVGKEWVSGKDIDAAITAAVPHANPKTIRNKLATDGKIVSDGARGPAGANFKRK